LHLLSKIADAVGTMLPLTRSTCARTAAGPAAGPVGKFGACRVPGNLGGLHLAGGIGPCRPRR
jgi:hypothetical protein